MMDQAELDELIDEFQDLDEREACELLEELGRDLPEVPQSIYVDENLVPGCQSRVWLVTRLTDGDRPAVNIQVDSDAFVVKGLAYVVLQMFGDKAPEEILETDYTAVFDRMGLGRLILPQRKNGLFSMVKRIRNFAAESNGETTHDDIVPGSLVKKANAKPTRSIEDIALEFPILQQTLPNGRRPVFLDSGASAQKPKSVIEKQREVEEQYYANAYRGRYTFGERIDDEIESARQKVAALIGATRTDEIVFTSGTTMSINMVAMSWARKHVKPGDEVVITELEHHANFVPWQVVAEQCGAKLRIIPISDSGLIELDAVKSAINKNTAVVAVTTMSNVLGTITPLDEIISIAHEHDAVVVADAAQSIPHNEVDITKSDIDFLAFSGHKLYGPSGIGVLYGKHQLLKDMDPFLYGGHMIQRVGRDQSTWSDPPAKFEAGTIPIVPIIGLGAAVDFINSIGYEAIHKHEAKLLAAAHNRLSQISNLKIYGPDISQKGAIVSFTVDNVSTEDLAYRLNDQGICTRHGHHCAMVLHERLGVPGTTRASFGVYNTLEDVEALAKAIESSLGIA